MRAAWLVLPLMVVGCAGMEENVRTERGPLLRSFERPRVVEGGVSGKVSVEPSGAKLTLELEGYDTCRTEKVEEYAEDMIHEHRGSGAGAGLSAGVGFTGAAAILLGVSYALSGEPNRSKIDGGGNYGAPPRILARNWSIALFCIGIPTLGAGLFQFLRTGEEVETVKVEQVASQHDETCNVRRIDGPVFVRGVAGGAAGPLPTSGGAVSVESKQVNADIDAFLFYEREVVLDDASVSLLHAFNGCGRLEREAVAEPAALSTGVLLKRLEAARACRQVRGDAVAAEQARLEAELLKRRAGSESGTYLPGAKRLQGFEEAVAAYPPRFTLTDDGASDADKGIELLNGQNVLVRGRVQTGLSPNIGVISYGNREVFVFLPPDAPWANADFTLGSVVEVVGTVSGLQTVGERTAPLVRAVWMHTVK